MAVANRKAEPAPDVTPQPFPGESPTVSLALAAGQMYGFHEDEKPKRAARAATKPKKSVKKKAAAPKRAKAGAASKTKAPRRGTAAKRKTTR